MDSAESITHLDQISLQLKNVRAWKRRSLRDCASVLGIAIEDYLKYEQGKAFPTLPELELLAIFFAFPPQFFIDPEGTPDKYLKNLSDEERPGFITLRNKMIRMKYLALKEKSGLTIEDIHKKTDIPLDTLTLYENENTAFKLEDLILIASCLDVPLKSFFTADLLRRSEERLTSTPQPNFQPESNQLATGMEEKDDPYLDLIEALKTIPKDDLARITKILLNSLKLT